MANATAGYESKAHVVLEKLFSCRLCGAHFCSARLLADHFDEHFSPGQCGNCDQQVLLINDEYYYLHIHITNKCFEEYQHSLNNDDEGPKITNILARVDIKEEIFEKPFIYEAESSTQEQFQYNGDEEEAKSEYLEMEEEKYTEVLDCMKDSEGSGYSIVKLEDNIDTEIFDPETTMTQSIIDSPEKNHVEEIDIEESKDQLWQSLAPLNSTCDICGELFNSDNHLNEHTKSHAELPSTETSGNVRVSEEGYPCDICKTTFATAAILKRHVQSLSCGPFRRKAIIYHFKVTCGIQNCKYVSKTSFGLYKHRVKRHKKWLDSSTSPADMQTLQFQCLVCKLYSATQKTLATHVKRYHNIKVKQTTPCDVCGKLFIQATNLAKHRMTHQKTKGTPNITEILPTDSKSSIQYECDLCKKQYMTKGAVVAHIKKHGRIKRAAKESHPCNICKQVLTSKVMLKRHMARIHGSEPVKETHFCDICGKGFATSGGLHHHKHRHKNPEPKYICTICGKGLRTLGAFSDHTNWHKGIKARKCGECGKLFGRASSLSTHMRLHTGIKPYICSEEGCDKTYAYRIDYKRHLWKQHQIYTKKFPCSICDQVFPENKMLLKHMKNHP